MRLGKAKTKIKRGPVLADVFLDISLKNQFLISEGDLFLIQEDQAHPGKSYLVYLGRLTKKLMKKIKALA